MTLELASAFQEILKPFHKAADVLFVEPALNVSYFAIDFWSRYLLDYPIGHAFMRAFIAPLMSYSVARVFDMREVFSLFGNAPDSIRKVIAGFSTIFNNRLITEPLKQIISNVAVVYSGVMYGDMFRSQAYKFFYFCTWHNGRFEGVELGTGNTNSEENAYFPEALSTGPQTLSKLNRGCIDNIVEAVKENKDDRKFHLNSRVAGFSQINASVISAVIDHQRAEVKQAEELSDCESQATTESVTDNEWEKEKINMEIAMSSLLFALLTYQTDEQIIEAQKAGMIKDIQVFVVDTGASGTQMIAFVNKDKKFAVFGYRGTQFQVMRQYLTSLDFRTEYFQSFRKADDESSEWYKSKIRKVYYNEVKKSFELVPFKTKFDGESFTARQLMEHLKINLGYKIYLTGHSLGGGLSTVLAAHLSTLSNDQTQLFDALVTFGGTPVGDKNFVTWFEDRVPVSWRFMFGDEFAPMVPPLPYFNPVDKTELVHVGDFHHFDVPPNTVAETAEEADELLRKLADSTGMMDIFMHHNPLLTLKALQEFHQPINKSRHDRLLLDTRSGQPKKTIVKSLSKMKIELESEKGSEK